MKNRRFAFALVLCLVLSKFIGCAAQPNREDLAEANSLFGKTPVSVTMDLNIVSGEVILYYDSCVLMQRMDAEWTGKCTMFYSGTYFTQECISVCSSDVSYKQWRGKWVQSDNISPMTQIEKWLQRVYAGEGSFGKENTDCHISVPGSEHRDVPL